MDKRSPQGDHYLPACLIGGFGRPGSRGGRRTRRRNAVVAVRFTSTPDQVRPIAAREVAKQRGIYRLQEPPPGVGANVIDDLWDDYEPHLPTAIREVEAGRATDPVWDVIKLHIIAQAVRHPDFDEAARTYLRATGIEEPSRDQIQRERVRTLDRTPELLAECRIAFVRRPRDGPRFVVNDKGYATLEDPDNRKGVLFPLSGSVGVLAVTAVGLYEGRAEPWVWGELTLTPGAVELLNEASWRLGGIRCVIGHPEDAESIQALSVDRELVAPLLGPFRGTGRADLFDWAFEAENPGPQVVEGQRSAR